ncbi:H/ACA ribonucleoprotein complex non-core subunit NAF1 [Cucurbita maxima]|uniref:H/ACA ribonucleoprotein complex non-core subunit NAF1 n=1 Tax=Cucurbita maxima TaxID=3661 RepID=A0A6J1I505_CUCMA|nr:H/ACA ribonucleoprotein complex non-core subunit NAF1 [Cucurbita maxima]
MVELSSNSTTASAPDGLLHASSKLKNSEPLPLDSFDSKPVDYSFADSFLDYDSLNDWIDEFTSPVMADAQTILPEAESHVNQPVEKSVPIVGEIQPIAQAGGEACAKSTDLNCIIEEGMSKVSLVIDGGSTGNIESDSREDDDESDAESEGTSSASTSSDSSSSSGSSDDGKDDDEESSSSSSSGDSSCHDDVETKENSVKADVHTEIGELEEGEISDADNEDKEASADDMVAWDGDGEELDEEEEAGPEGGPISSKNELKVLPPVPQVHATLQPHHQMVPVGVVLSIIGSQVIVEGVEKHNPLNEGSILWLTVARSPLGLVDEIFGPVKNPYYSVRYNSESEVPTGISSGTHVSFVLEFADYVLNNKDLYKKGYDASGANDEEVSDNEFSDDEKELEFKKMQKLAKRGMNDNQQINENRNNARKKKNNAKARKFGQRTFETPQEHDKSRNYGQAIPQQATVPEGSKFDHSAPQQVKMDMAQSFSNQNQHTGPPLAPFVYHGGYPNPSASEQRFINGPGVMPSFPPAYNPCFPPAMNGIRPAEMPFQFQQQQQQQQNLLFPNGLPMNGMPWLLQNPVQQVPQPQMPMMNTFAGAPYPPGFVGTSSTLPNPLTAVGAQGIHSGGVQFGQNQNMHPPTQQFSRSNPHPPVPFQGSVAPEQFNQGSSSNRGRKLYGRGGPHFRGRRGGGRQPR